MRFFQQIMRQKSQIIGKLCENCAILHNIFKEKWSMFQFIKVANQA